jgi:hypothetical protein
MVEGPEALHRCTPHDHVRHSDTHATVAVVCQAVKPQLYL